MTRRDQSTDGKSQRYDIGCACRSEVILTIVGQTAIWCQLVPTGLSVCQLAAVGQDSTSGNLKVNILSAVLSCVTSHHIASHRIPSPPCNAIIQIRKPRLQEHLDEHWILQAYSSLAASTVPPPRRSTSTFNVPIANHQADDSH